MKNLIRQAIPFFLGSLGTEFAAAKRVGRPEVFQSADTRTSITMGIINTVLEGLQAPLTRRFYQYLYDHRLMDFPLTGTPRRVAILVVDDFMYYWFHRLHHEVRVLWMAHVNHHSSEKYNLSTALRQSWATPWTKIPFWAPMAMIGITPEEIEETHAINLLYQFWVHTELIDNLGPFEEIFSTPSHHRAHHGSNLRYLDTNYGGIFIIWDRLFGTFEREDKAADPVRYGLISNVGSFRIVDAEFHEAIAILKDIKERGGVANALKTLFNPPGWAPGPDSQTVAELRQRAM
jgi:sterol desaturase/sphingolipid hydroxylase (fatty acid hydroxylase superfamily)